MPVRPADDLALSLSHENYEDFLEELQKHRYIDRVILDSSNFDRDDRPNQFLELAKQFETRQVHLESCIQKIRQDISLLEEKIKIKEKDLTEAATKVILWDSETELKRHEVKQKETFLRLVQEEKKREEFDKTKAMEMFLSNYSNDALNLET